VDVRTIAAGELEQAGALLYAAFAGAAEARGFPAPWRSARDAADLLARQLEAEPGAVAVAITGGAIVGVGAVRVRGEVASLGPIAVAADGRGIGGRLLDHLVEVADDRGAQATRLYADGWNPAAYGLYAGRGFSVIDVVAHIERPPGEAPALDSSRGLEVRPPDARDLDEIALLDAKLTGHQRRGDLEAMRSLEAGAVGLVARRHNQLVGYLAGRPDQGQLALGPAMAVDVSDLFILVANALAGHDGVVRARLSTAAPAASMAALGLGFRVRELGLVMSRGAPPPARPPQLYSIEPEIL
jgi:ribosomal protein S18 acetylase RimI-like enzyme